MGIGEPSPSHSHFLFAKLIIEYLFPVCTIIGCIGVVIAPIPLVFYKYGAAIRKRSKFAPCLDLKIKDQVEREEREKKSGSVEA